MTGESVVEAFLRDREIEFTRAGSQFSMILAGEHKHRIPVGLALRDDGVRLESFFMRAPRENIAETYRLLLARNARARAVWFAVDADGDVFLLGHASAVEPGELDRLMGEVLTTADAMFMPALSLGFAGYLAQDMAWRRKQLERAGDDSGASGQGSSRS